MEATLGFEPRIKALQAHALPLGYVALLTSKKVVPRAGLEPARKKIRGILSPLCLPFHHLGDAKIYLIKNKMERETRVELATSTMARSRSTTELFPHLSNENRILSNTSLNFYNFFKKISNFLLLFYR